MGNKTDSGPYINTITNSHWLLLLFVAAFVASFYWQMPSIFVYVIGSIIGIYCCAIILVATGATKMNLYAYFCFSYLL